MRSTGDGTNCALDALGKGGRKLGSARHNSSSKTRKSNDTDVPESIPGHRILGKLGQGATSVVYEAFSIRRQARVAIKLMKPLCYLQSDMVKRFEREARVAQRVRSDYIVTHHDFGRTSCGIPYIVLERLHGEDLAEHLKRSDPMGVEEALGCAWQICVGLSHLHDAGIVHRDIKPSNIFLAVHPSGMRVKILDLGIATHREEQQITADNFSIGTPRFMSPEQLLGASIDERSDQWALGILLYRMLAGVYPFEGESPAEIADAVLIDPAPNLLEKAPWIDEALAGFVMRLLQKDSRERFQSIHDALVALVGIIDGPPTLRTHGPWA